MSVKENSCSVYATENYFSVKADSLPLTKSSTAANKAELDSNFAIDILGSVKKFSAFSCIFRRKNSVETVQLHEIILELSSLVKAGLNLQNAYEHVLSRMVESNISSADFRLLEVIVNFVQQVGSDITQILEFLSHSLRESKKLATEQKIALTPARTTVKLLSTLPLFSIVLGYLLGISPIEILVFNTAGNIALAAGLLFYLLGNAWSKNLLSKTQVPSISADFDTVDKQRHTGSKPKSFLFRSFLGVFSKLRSLRSCIVPISDRKSRLSNSKSSYVSRETSDFSVEKCNYPEYSSIDIVLIIDFFIVGTKAGCSITKVLEIIADSCELEFFRHISRKLYFGLDWDSSWKKLPDEYKVLSNILSQTWVHGISPLELLQYKKEEIFNHRQHQLHVSIAKLSTQLTMPLGLCYLPSFVSLGLLPLIISSGDGFVY